MYRLFLVDSFHFVNPNLKMLDTAIKDLRRYSSKLDRIWATLSKLRDELSASPAAASSRLSFPDPYGPPASFAPRITRSGSSQESPISIAHSGQMLPVLVTLTNLAGQTRRIRELLEAAVKETREVNSEEREAQKRENERFDSDKKALLSLTSTDTERAARVSRWR
jgi:hypothetical protein